jgi:predicted site-specific integrase-resolvase
LGVNPKTLRKWAKQGKVPCFVNPANKYRFYVKVEVLKSLRLFGVKAPPSVDIDGQ